MQVERKRRSTIWIALCASVALHAAAVLVLALLPSPPAPVAPPPESGPIAIELFELPAAPATPPEPAARPPAAAPKRRRTAPPAAPAAPSGEGEAEASSAPPATPGDGQPAGGEDRPGAVSLVPGDAFTRDLMGPGGAEEAPEGDDGVAVPESDRYGWAGPGSGVHAPRIPSDLFAETAAEAVGRRRAELGIVDPYFRQVGKTLEQGWQVDRKAPPPETLEQTVKELGKAIVRFKDVWQEGAERFGQSGNPLADGVGQAFDHGVLADGSDRMKAQLKFEETMRAGFTSVRRAVIRVVQDEDGKVLLVELVEPSRDRDMDVQALADVRSMAERLPPPPPDLLGTRTRLSSFWSFEIRLRVIPPSTGVAFEFDEKGVQPLVPFGHQIKKRVRLLYFN